MKAFEIFEIASVIVITALFLYFVLTVIRKVEET